MNKINWLKPLVGLVWVSASLVFATHVHAQIDIGVTFDEYPLATRTSTTIVDSEYQTDGADNTNSPLPFGAGFTIESLDGDGDPGISTLYNSTIPGQPGANDEVFNLPIEGGTFFGDDDNNNANSAATGGNDQDIEVSNTGNVLITQEPGNGTGAGTIPDDEPGATDILIFETPLEQLTFILVDVEEGGVVRFFDSDGDVVAFDVDEFIAGGAFAQPPAVHPSPPNASFPGTVPATFPCELGNEQFCIIADPPTLAELSAFGGVTLDDIARFEINYNNSGAIDSFELSIPSGNWSGNVSEDVDNNGSGDVPIAGVEISLFRDINGDGVITSNAQIQFDSSIAPNSPTVVNEFNSVVTTTTDANGDYEFLNLVAGEYIAVETQPAGFGNVSEDEGGLDNDGSAASNTVINQIAGTVDPGETDVNNDFVEDRPRGSIEVTKALIDPDNGFNNVDFTIEVQCNDTDLPTSPTSQTFNLQPGATGTINNILIGTQCTVSEPNLPAPPADFEYQPVVISTPNPVTIVDGATQNVTVTNELVALDLPVAIGSFVFLDSDGDGTQNVAGGTFESGIAGAEVELFVLENGVFTPATDLDGNTVPTQTTGANGLYFFNNLPEGDYQVQVTPPATPAGLEPTINQVDDDNQGFFDSNIAGETAPGSGVFVSPTINLEAGGEGGEGGAPGDNQDNNNPGQDSGDTSVDFGFVALTSIGSVVFEDLNGNSLQDASDARIAGAQVTLLNAADGSTAEDVNGVPATVATDEFGRYFFDDLLPGNYIVQVQPGAGFFPAPLQSPNDDGIPNDSNINLGATGLPANTFQSGVINLAPGAEPVGGAEQGAPGTGAGDGQDDASDANGDMTIDFGFVAPVAIGSYVFLDTDADGSQVNEPPVNGATVTLFVDNGAGLFVPATDLNGVTVPSQVTSDGTFADDGVYFFDNLPEGQYRVQVTPPAGFDQTPIQTTVDDSSANDLDSNIASEPTPGTFESPTITLTRNGEGGESLQPGDTLDNTIPGENSGDLSVDFGFVIEAAINIEKTVYAGNDGGAQCATATELVTGVNGDAVTYCFEITNTGDTFLDAVTLTDNDLTPAVTRANATLLSGTEPLAPNASLVFFVDSTITGDLTNTASTSGNPTDAGGNDIPGVEDPTDSDDAAVAEVGPAINIEKTVYAGNDGGAQCATATELVTGVNGDAVTYCFEITNTGDTFLDAVTLRTMT